MHPILRHSGLFWAILGLLGHSGHSGPFWAFLAILGYFGHFGPRLDPRNMFSPGLLAPQTLIVLDISFLGKTSSILDAASAQTTNIQQNSCSRDFFPCSKIQNLCQKKKKRPASGVFFQVEAAQRTT